MNADKPERAKVIDHADELARRFEDYVPADDDRKQVSALTRERLAALKHR